MILPEISRPDTRVAILLGDINNKTQIVSSNDFELAARRLRNQLVSLPLRTALTPQVPWGCVGWFWVSLMKRPPWTTWTADIEFGTAAVDERR